MSRGCSGGWGQNNLTGAVWILWNVLDYRNFVIFFMKNITLVMTLSPEFWLFQTMLSQQPYMFDMWFFRYFWITFQEHLIYVVQSDILCCWIFTDHCIFFIEPLILFTPNKWQIDPKFIHLIFLANINAYREFSMEIWCQ